MDGRDLAGPFPGDSIVYWMDSDGVGWDKTVELLLIIVLCHAPPTYKKSKCATYLDYRIFVKLYFKFQGASRMKEALCWTRKEVKQK